MQKQTAENNYDFYIIAHDKLAHKCREMGWGKNVIYKFPHTIRSPLFWKWILGKKVRIVCGEV